MKSLTSLFITFLISILLFSCSTKTADVKKTNWVKLDDLKIEVPSDQKLYSHGMNSGFFFITPHSSSFRSYHVYYNTYREMVENLFPDNVAITYNDRVEHYLNFFSFHQRRNFERWLERSETLLPELKRLLKEENLPTDLAYIALIESGYNPNARSRMNAVGMWQFIRSTGKIYGLRIDSYVDERRDIHKSTLAAANYLRDMKEDFGSWELSMSGYNCGNLRVKNSMKKTNSGDFWYLSSTLPRETRNYVPKYIAAMIISKNPEKYGFSRPNYTSYDIVKTSVPGQKSLSDIAKVIELEPKKLKKLNPSLYAGMTPPDKNYEINIPSSHKEIIDSKSVEIASLKNVKKRTSIAYKVRSGDNLSVIARRFGTSISSIKRANNLRGSFLRAGQRLRIPTRGSSSYRTTYKKPNNSKRRSSAGVYVVKSGDTLGEIAEKYGVGLSKLKKRNGIGGSSIRAGQKLHIPTGSKNSTNYKIRNGDTLSEIATKYRVSVADIQKWNNLNSTRLVAGDKIKIYH